MSESLHQFVREIDLWWWVIAGGSLLLAITVVVLARFRMIQTRPMRVCIVLSVVAHLLLLGSAHLLRLFDVPSFPGDNTIQLQLSFDEETIEPSESDQADQPPAAEPELRLADRRLQPAGEPEDQPPVADVDPKPPPALPTDDPSLAVNEAIVTDQQPPAVEPLELVPPALPLDANPLSEAADEPDQVPSAAAPAEPEQVASTPMETVEPPTTQSAERLAAPDDRLLPVDPAPLADIDRSPSPTPKYVPPPPPKPVASKPPPHRDHQWHAATTTNPERYQLRDESRRSEIARQRGGNKSSEEAVEAALGWLVRNQQSDGRWSAARHGAGRGHIIEGQHRHTTGMQADTGVSGLALLAMLGAGHTHQRGSHKKSVQLGLEYVMSQQRSDGCLGGKAGTFAQMYCHGIATLALCEACAMTGDQRLEPFTRRAVEYTLRSQHRTTGGWRYSPGDPGDTSQFGWQLMVVESAPHTGMRLPSQTRPLCRRFLANVSSGAHGGLASYRPGQAPTVSMTAEALACRVLLGNVDARQAEESARLIISHPPRAERRNLYYWYYATLALHQLDSEYWPSWNTALQRALIPTQRRRGSLAGSWDTDTVWGGCGGRVYTTAMAALCLEVYYRYLPVYRHEMARR